MRIGSRRDYEKNNFLAAEIIAQDPEKYGGESALPVRWARAYLAAHPRPAGLPAQREPERKSETERRPASVQGLLFETAEAS